MEDRQIVELYWQRSEEALVRTAEKYGAYARAIACRILENREDGEECVNDAYVRLWNAIPPEKPESLMAYLGAAVRNLAMDRCRARRAEKRGGGRTEVVLEELRACEPERLEDQLALTEVLNRFLAELPPLARKIFLRRYWYFDPVAEIAERYGLTEGKVKMQLFRTRRALKRYLEQEGIWE